MKLCGFSWECDIKLCFNETHKQKCVFYDLYYHYFHMLNVCMFRYNRRFQSIPLATTSTIFFMFLSHIKGPTSSLELKPGTTVTRDPRSFCWFFGLFFNYYLIPSIWSRRHSHIHSPAGEWEEKEHELAWVSHIRTTHLPPARHGHVARLNRTLACHIKVHSVLI